MLTPEIIEKAVILLKPEGFNIITYYGLRALTWNIHMGSVAIKQLEQSSLYPHLLTRLIEAINKNSVAVVNYRHPSYQIFKTTYLEPDECFDAEADPDLAKEEVIKYIMENL